MRDSMQVKLETRTALVTKPTLNSTGETRIVKVTLRREPWHEEVAA